MKQTKLSDLRATDVLSENLLQEQPLQSARRPPLLDGRWLTAPFFCFKRIKFVCHRVVSFLSSVREKTTKCNDEPVDSRSMDSASRCLPRSCYYESGSDASHLVPTREKGRADQQCQPHFRNIPGAWNSSVEAAAAACLLAEWQHKIICRSVVNTKQQIRLAQPFFIFRPST